MYETGSYICLVDDGLAGLSISLNEVSGRLLIPVQLRWRDLLEHDCASSEHPVAVPPRFEVRGPVELNGDYISGAVGPHSFHLDLLLQSVLERSPYSHIGVGPATLEECMQRSQLLCAQLLAFRRETTNPVAIGSAAAWSSISTSSSSA